MLPGVTLYYKATVIKQRGTGIKKQTCRPMEQNEMPRNNPMPLWSINM